MIPEISITQFLAAAKKAGMVEDIAADYNRGSDYDALAGASAILWSRQSQRDSDLWKATRFNDAEGQSLTELGEGRYGIPRILDTRGKGTAVFTRPAGGLDTIWSGTRIMVPGSVPRFYRVVSDVATTSLEVPVDIEAVEYGVGTRIDVSTSAKLIDPLADTGWSIKMISCDDGTVLEPASDYRTRIRTTRSSSRVGQEARIIEACQAAGAGQVALFRSDYAPTSTDNGLPYIYVGDLSYNGTAALVRACTLAIRSVRVMGDNVQVLRMARVSAPVTVNVYLRDAPTKMPVARLDALHRGAIMEYMNGGDGRFTYTKSGLESAIARVSIDVQDVEVLAPVSDTVIVNGGNFPLVLTRYFTEDAVIKINYYGPE